MEDALRSITDGVDVSVVGKHGDDDLTLFSYSLDIFGEVNTLLLVLTDFFLVSIEGEDFELSAFQKV